MATRAAPLNWPRTLVARGAGALRNEHLRRQPTEARSGSLHCFVLDCSASMLAQGRLARAKGLLLDLMAEAYRRREQVALLCFAGNTVELRLPPRRPAAWNDGWVAPIAGGGGTPLALAVARAAQLLQRSPAQRRWLWLLTDGRSREAPERPAAAEMACVVDFEGPRAPLRRAEALAQAWRAQYWQADVPAFTNIPGSRKY
ncbi:VWA domain-containing protein [Xylophilus sp. GW821-FHT01B05]